ncbi:MAG: hypothetical protein U0S13_04050 [Mycobacterium sp.]
MLFFLAEIDNVTHPGERIGGVGLCWQADAFQPQIRRFADMVTRQVAFEAQA